MAGPLPAEEALEGQQLAAAADEAGGRRVLQLAEAGLQGGAQVGTGAGRGWRGKQPRVGLLLVEHRDEPVGEMQCAGAEDPAAEVVVLEVALAGEHGVADAPAGGQRPVEGEHEAPGGLDQDAVAHGHDRGDADLEQLRGDRFRRLLGLRALAGFEEDQRDAVRLQQRAERVGMDGQMLAPLQLGDVPRVFEAEPAEADPAVVDAVAVEVDDVVGRLGVGGGLQRMAQRGQCWRVQHPQLDQAAEVFHRIDQRQRAGAVVDIAAGVVLRAGRDHQDADRGGDYRDVQHLGVGQALAHAGGSCALESGSRRRYAAVPRADRARRWRPRGR